MQERQLKILGIFVSLSLVLLNYQNCGSSKGADGAPAAGADMGIINPVVAGGISFVQTKATVNAADTELAIDGLCSKEQSGGMIGWQALDEEQTVVASGKSLCEKGGFEVLFAGVENLACGSKLTLKAAFGSKSKSELEIEKNCL
ncbi:MAG: hypothetical protein IT287_09290 [Bdellovibrionaceae bacterium]|nr:hypothetical protein [Pseudobdellovibrionaceae bacterium]